MTPAKGLTNLEIAAEQVVLDLKPIIVTNACKNIQRLEYACPTMQGSEPVMQFVQLCAIEINS